MSKRFLAVLIFVFLLIGCQPSAMLIRMVPDQPGLKETELTFYSDAAWLVRDKIAIIDVDGLIMNQSQTGRFTTGENPLSCV